MTQEDKAKAYDEAYKRATIRFGSNVANELFPELKESEDERIRKLLISGMKNLNYNAETFAFIPIKDVIAWLEKQGEQKPFDYENANIQQKDFAPKVEPKFKVDDYIKHNKANIICKIISVNNGSYYVENIETNGGIELFNAEQNFHLWTIQDAKDGDVLCCESGWTCIFKSLNSNNISFSSYCFMDNTGWFFETGSDSHTLDENFIKAYNGKIYPATKEQRDTLFAKMKEAEYEWDAEKKELKEIEPKPNTDFGEYISESLTKQFPEVSFAKLSRIAVRVKKWLEQKKSAC